MICSKVKIPQEKETRLFFSFFFCFAPCEIDSARLWGTLSVVKLLGGNEALGWKMS